jgi:hypothetical protein
MSGGKEIKLVIGNGIGMKLEKQWENGLCVCWAEHNGNM